MVNNGKQFETDFKNSIPADIWKHRPSDTAGLQMARFTNQSICDLIVFNPACAKMFLFELKSTIRNTWSLPMYSEYLDYLKKEKEYESWALSVDRKLMQEKVKEERKAVKAIGKKLNSYSVKLHQILTLQDAGTFSINGYFVFTIIPAEATYAVPITVFIDFWKNHKKRSINQKDLEGLLETGAQKIPQMHPTRGKKWQYDLSKLLA